MHKYGKILIVDDEKITLKNLEHVMKKEGYEVVGTDKGPDALKLLEEQNFDVVLTDFKMKKVDGRQILKRCRELHPDTEVIMITGYATLGSAVDAMKQGAFHYISKPFKLDAVRKVVGEALEGKMRHIADGKLEKVALDLKDKEIVSLINTFNKILRELDLKQRHKQRHLVQSEKLASLGTLLSRVAHELNNPLSNISTSCQILIEEFDDADIEYKKELLSQIDLQTERSRNIVRSLLEFSRNKEFNKERLPLKKLFEETILFIRGELIAGTHIILEIPDELNILADKQRIQQVFLNLIKNALDSIADEGSLTISARARTEKEKKELCAHKKYRGRCTGKCPAEKATVDIEIEDTGTGIPPEVLPQIFDPFFTTKDTRKGSGLGLYIVQEIIHEHYGCIAVQSEIGKGTCFLIRLPLGE